MWRTAAREKTGMCDVVNGCTDAMGAMVAQWVRENRALQRSMTARGKLTHHHVCILASRKTNNVLCFATNEPLATSSVHAEVRTLRTFSRRAWHAHDVRRGVTLVSLRVSSTGRLRMARPCVSCARHIARCALVTHVWWSTDNGSITTAA